jgi:hypothetical protein
MALALALCVATDIVTSTAAPRFYPDDPLWTDDDMSLDASDVKPVEDSNGYDFVVNTFVKPGEKRDVRAMNVNTVDEVPDSSWFVNRIGRRDMSIQDIVRGPDRFPTISLDGWVVSAGKSSGVQAGFRMDNPAELNSSGLPTRYQIEFDPPSNPEMATGAELIGTAFYHAFGYHVVDVYLAEVDPARLEISPKAEIADPALGRKRPLVRDDIDDVLRRSARQPDGKYRVLASRFADGTPLGNFRYYGTRPDDPNDTVPHEHRRELRAARVFGAWLNHDDSRGVNSLDFLPPGPPPRWVKHYMFDFGSILGSGTRFSQRNRAGNEYLLEWAPGWAALATLGLYTRPWMHIKYPAVPASVGSIEGDAFVADRWKPEYPNQAFANMRPDDAFWAARIIAKFDDRAIRAIVEKARFSDARATDYLVETIIKRRDKVLNTWLTGVNPVVDVAMNARGEMTFDNAAVRAGLASAMGMYRVQWARFDNTTGTATPEGAPVTTALPRVQAPATLVDGPQPAFIQAEIAGLHPGFPAWSQPVIVHFRRIAGGWQLVGLRRMAD